MDSWTEATSGTDHWRAVVRPTQLQSGREVQRPEPSLAIWVEQVWSLSWAEPIPSTASAVISHPTAQLTVEAGPPGEVRHGHQMPAALLHGVPQTRFAPALPAFGWVVGLHLAPGSLYDLTGSPAWRWTDRVVPWALVWPVWDLTAVWAAADHIERATELHLLAAHHLADRTPTTAGQLARKVELTVRNDSQLQRVEQLTEAFSLSLRSLQRLCRDHLGVSPTWLLRRARTIDAHERLSTTDAEVAAVAAELGWYDQAHFTRDYTAITGTSPVRLRRARAADLGNADLGSPPRHKVSAGDGAVPPKPPG